MSISLVYSDIAFSMTIPAPTVSDGDIMIASFVNDVGDGIVGASLAGWAAIHDREHAGASLGYQSMYKVASSESGSYAFSGTGDAATIHIFRDSVGGGTWSIPDDSTAEATSTTADTAAVAVTTDDAIFCVFTNDGAKAVDTAPSGMTLGEATNSDGSYAIFCYYEFISSPDASDSRQLIWGASDQIVQGATVIRYTAAGGDTNVSAATEALTITEQAATISVDVDIAANVEALTITEFAATIALNVDISAATESLVITENAATIVFDVNINASTEALTITSYSATVDVGGDTTIAASTEALVITPQAAGIGYDVDVSASTESLVLTTQAATVLVGVNVLASVESLTITTQSATIGKDTVVTAATEALTITPNAATIDSSGATTLTAQDITNIVDALFAKVVENGETFEQQLKLIRAEAAGKLAQVGNTVTIRDAADTKDRITATVDSNGQRTAIVTDVT